MATAHLTSLATVAVAIYASDAPLVAAALSSKAVIEVSDRFVIGGGTPTQAAATAAGAAWVRTTSELIAQMAPTVTHVWLIHDDASPRPDALRALVQAAEQIDASLVGSKVLRADNPSILESVGGATDVFLVPDPGLATGELDQEQYDVVRDVAFVPGESVLIRRDLLKGLGGPDQLLPPLTQAIDFAGRARSAGGRVAVVPSSEVLHSGTCQGTVPTWREPAARWRAAAKLYSGWTTAWVLPTGILIAALDALVRFFMLDFRPALDVAKAIGWNVKHLGGTFGARRQARKIAQVDDGEVFRYQRAGSLILSGLGLDLTDWLRERSATLGVVSRLDEERMFWQRPGFAYQILALATIVAGTRSLLLSGVPKAGYMLRLPADPLAALGAYAGGWNSVGFGTAGPGHPAAAAVAAMQLVLPNAALVFIIVASLVFGLLGLRRLLRTFGIDGVPAVVGSLAAVASLAVWGSGTAGYWPTYPALAAAPWMITSAMVPWPAGWRGRSARFGGLMFASLVVGMFVPLALGSALVVGLFWVAFGTGSRLPILVRALVAAVSGLAGLGPWLWYSSMSEVLMGGQPLPFAPPVWLAGGLALGAFLAVLSGSEPYLNVAGVGALVAITGAVGALVAPGLEPSAAALVLLCLGVGLLVGGVAGGLKSSSGISRFVVMLSQVAVVAALVAVGLAVGTGRWGLPADQFSDLVDLTEARSGDQPIGRVLLIGSGLPGQTREVTEVPYKVVGGDFELADGWLPTYREADRALETAIVNALSPDVLRPGLALGVLGIRWVVVTDPSLLDPALEGKLDLKQLDVGDGSFRIFENVQPAFVAKTADGLPWSRERSGFSGPAAAEVLVAANPTAFGQTDVPMVLDGSTGRVSVQPDRAMRILGWAAGISLLGSALLAAVGLRERR